MVFIYMFRGALASFLLGLLWINMDDNAIQPRVTLSAVAYIYVAASVADLFDGNASQQ
jgi:hypothetical protein